MGVVTGSGEVAGGAGDRPIPDRVAAEASEKSVKPIGWVCVR